MNAYSETISPPDMYVRALYDYAADDRTSLSFRQGDIIQVLTQLESGWWDGVINGVRGWFPSNYCVFVAGTEADRADHGDNPNGGHGDFDGDSDTEYDQNGYEIRFHKTSRVVGLQSSGMHNVQTDQEEAAFWIPQAMPDGRLYYFNTLTGVSTMELPLETPAMADESGPRDRANVFANEQIRPPPDMMAGGYEKDDETDFDQSASETEETSNSRSFVSSIHP